VDDIINDQRFHRVKPFCERSAAPVRRVGRSSIVRATKKPRRKGQRGCPSRGKIIGMDRRLSRVRWKIIRGIARRTGWPSGAGAPGVIAPSANEVASSCIRICCVFLFPAAGFPHLFLEVPSVAD